MAWTADDVARLERAIASGTRRVRWANGDETEYQSIADMLEARDRMKGEVAASGTSPPSRTFYVAGYGKGLR